MQIARLYAHARATPDRLALVCEHQRYSYGQFAALIEAARRRFAGEGFSPGDLVVLVTPSRLDAWTLGLGLRGLGVTTLAAPKLAELPRLGLERVAAVVAAPGPEADDAARALGARLIATDTAPTASSAGS